MKRFLRVILVLSVLAMTLGVGVATASAQGLRVHIVQYGEYLGLIAQHYGTTVQAIATLNGLTNPSRIYPGQRLFIPPTGGPVTPGPSVHIVQAGENLFRIALRYGTTVQAIASANGIYDPNRIYVGQRLYIPRAPRYHTVQRGEYLSLIARYYGSTVAAIMNANGIVNPNLIYPGQVLVIP